ncbi:long-chain fatty acid transport protein 4-like [Cloeon dipterum]|uniref:long-chain fatty acid transport protein 4-like n=1 Tax=Cloeon dipterum TaxID=197152 RepID=UPI00321FF9C5
MKEDKISKLASFVASVLILIFQPLALILQFAYVTVFSLFVWKLPRVWTIIKTLPRDLGLVKVMIKVKAENRRFKKYNMSPASMLSDLANDRPDDVFILFKDQIWTYKQLDELSWKVTNCFHKRGFKQGDVVALVSTNRPEYVAIWVGLSRLGVVTALVNTSLRKKALQHSLNIVRSKAVIVSNDLVDAISEIKDAIPNACKLFSFNGADQKAQHYESFDFLNPLLNAEQGHPIESLRFPNYDNALLYIFTSGTTGLPKAAIMKTSRYLCVALSAINLAKLDSKDRLYIPLPLYHSAGTVVGFGSAFTRGLSCVLREKFSASKYWEDCSQNKCTVAQYIGEMCRYLLIAPETPFDKDHKVVKMLGNGLKEGIWKRFLDRFAIQKVVEFYGATEGNCNIVNSEGKIGAVGFLPIILPDFANPLALVRANEQTGELTRDKDNFCIRCKPGEPGMIIGKIMNSDASRQFHGYLNNESASDKKVAYDVFTEGDKYFMSGDILVKDELGYLYFKDRTGDTFRWKGENVSNVEVENALADAVGLRDICVYGVEIPQSDGRAGMATIVDADSSLNLDELAKALSSSLPSYAQPIFLRIAQKIDMTSTFKLKKFNLQNEGFDPAKVGNDTLYFRRARSLHFEELTQELYGEILSGKIRF